MQEFGLLGSLGALPRPFDPERAARGLERWRAAAADDASGALDRIGNDIRGRALLEAIFGNSPYLGQSALQEPALLARLLSQGPKAVLAEVLGETGRAARAADTAAALMAPLRRAKRRVALLTAVADIADLWTVEQVTNALADFAEAAASAAVDRLLLDAAAAGEIELPQPEDPGRGSGYCIIGMGKLGARELNYSSDIDLFVLFDQDVVRYVGAKSPQDCYVRLTRGLVKLMQERTHDGYVFRTDLRLRPDPGATPVALSMAAAENYYESLGQNWERAALIKARPVAGDREAGRQFLDRIAPFIWRKNLDFAAIEDIHSIKRQIHAHKGHGRIKVAGHNIKLGRGGIREIEFFAQTQQLIAGGRDRRLRLPATCAAIRALAETGRIQGIVAGELIDCYEFLRRLEHRLQMIADEQTHSLPADETGIAQIATFLGHADAAAFEAELRRVLETVQGHYAALFEQEPELGTDTGSLVFTGTEDDPETIETLRKLGFHEPPAVATTIRGWHHGRYRAMRSTRARELLTALMPRLLQALAATASADAALARFDEFLGRLPAGVQLFSLLQANPGLLDFVAEVMGSAPRLAEHLSRSPHLFDGLISADFFAPLPDAARLRRDLERALETARDFQDVLDGARRWVNDRRLQIGAQLLRGGTDGEGTGIMLAAVADAALQALMPLVTAEFAQNHGRVPQSGLGIIAVGRLGSREMTLESDLDLIFVYDVAPGVELSDGRKPLPPSQYFGRLAQRFINAVTALTAEGRLFEVDMRLRPSGHAGPVAVSLETFTRYQQEDAWTWEHMALTRARVIAGPERLTDRVAQVIRAVLTRRRDPAKLVADVADMRRRIASEHAETDPWAVKHVRGGLVDVEFLAQYLQLRHAASAPDVLDPHTRGAFGRLAAAGCLPETTARELADADKLLGDTLALVRLCHSGRFEAATAAPGLKALLVRLAGAADFAALERRLVDTEARVRGWFETLVEKPAAAIPSDAPAETETEGTMR